MSFSDETLGAYVDGELDAAARALIEDAARTDVGLQVRIARYRTLRNQLQTAFAGELAEPVPDRLLATLRDPAPAGSAPLPNASVIDLASARNARTQRSRPVAGGAGVGRYALAASVLIALGAGLVVWRERASALIANLDGTSVAQGTLSAALSDQLSGSKARSDVSIGLSFRAKNGDYCRTFTLPDEAGLACRNGSRWEVLALAPAKTAAAPATGLRTASSSMPAKILQAIEQRMQGEPLDRAGEAAARAAGWNGRDPH